MGRRQDDDSLCWLLPVLIALLALVVPTLQEERSCQFLPSRNSQLGKRQPYSCALAGFALTMTLFRAVKSGLLLQGGSSDAMRADRRTRKSTRRKTSAKGCALEEAVRLEDEEKAPERF